MGRLPGSLDAPPSGRARAIWFDAAAYGRAKLLGGGEVPWRAPAELSAFFAKVQGMFNSDAILVDIAEGLTQRAASYEQLRSAMAARSRPGYALRTLLADEQGRTAAAEAVRVLAATRGAVPLVLTMPSPGRWAAAAAEQAGSAPGSPGASQAEAAAMYCADYLRLFGDAGADGLLLDEGPAAGELIHPESYRSVLNVAQHYEWQVLISAEQAAAWPFGVVPGVAVWLGSAAPGESSGRWGLVAGDEFWDGADPPADAGLVLAKVPAAANPEAVMKRVRALA